GFMVENHEDAWPQIGLDQAALVIEAPIEGRMPRMIAFFTEEQEIDQVGPIRSARPYYIDWNAELDAVYAHVGGSPAALELLQVDDTIDINEFSNEWFFWRKHTRLAPHNVYSSMELLQDAMERFVNRFGEQDNNWESWEFKNHAEDFVTTVSSVSIDFAGEPYVINWEFDEDEGNYIRHQYQGRLHEMEDGSLIKADNIAIIETDIKVLDKVGRRSVRTTGVGDALVFQDGIMIEATWKKSSKNVRTRFYDRETDEEIVMNAGVTWIEVISSLEDDVDFVILTEAEGSSEE
ncbi:MAG: DUF3048 domain-containing protein, partial [bacterium]|nr:DUF3048 domain-containing protein [bacterium]